MAESSCLIGGNNESVALTVPSITQTPSVHYSAKVSSIDGRTTGNHPIIFSVT